jgi:hypothetical protein
MVSSQPSLPPTPDPPPAPTPGARAVAAVTVAAVGMAAWFGLVGVFGDDAPYVAGLLLAAAVAFWAVVFARALWLQPIAARLGLSVRMEFTDVPGIQRRATGSGGFALVSPEGQEPQITVYEQTYGFGGRAGSGPARRAHGVILRDRSRSLPDLRVTRRPGRLGLLARRASATAAAVMGGDIEPAGGAVVVDDPAFAATFEVMAGEANIVSALFASASVREAVAASLDAGTLIASEHALVWDRPGRLSRGLPTVRSVRRLLSATEAVRMSLSGAFDAVRPHPGGMLAGA